MKCKILHETTGRLRVHLCCGRMSLSQADVLEYYLLAVASSTATESLPCSSASIPSRIYLIEW